MGCTCTMCREKREKARLVASGTAAGRSLVRSILTWENVAKIIGEELGSAGSEGYYRFTPEEWLRWIRSEIVRAKQSDQYQRVVALATENAKLRTEVAKQTGYAKANESAMLRAQADSNRMNKEGGDWKARCLDAEEKLEQMRNRLIHYKGVLLTLLNTK